MRNSLGSLWITSMMAGHSVSLEAMAYADRTTRAYSFSFTGKYPKKQNKLSQKAKRKRARRTGKYG